MTLEEIRSYEHKIKNGHALPGSLTVDHLSCLAQLETAAQSIKANHTLYVQSELDVELTAHAIVGDTDGEFNVEQARRMVKLVIKNRKTL